MDFKITNKVKYHFPSLDLFLGTTQRIISTDLHNNRAIFYFFFLLVVWGFFVGFGFFGRVVWGWLVGLFVAFCLFVGGSEDCFGF